VQSLRAIEDLEEKIGSVSFSADGNDGSHPGCQAHYVREDGRFHPGCPAHGALEDGGDDAWGCSNHEPDELEPTCDSRTGEVLDPDLVHEARKEEIAYMKSIGLYTKVSLQECWEKTGTHHHEMGGCQQGQSPEPGHPLQTRGT
jgi:hypothetical protein